MPADHPAFDGHFPGNPILPGVVLLDQVVALVVDGALGGCGGHEGHEGHEGAASDAEAAAGVEIAEGKFLEAVRPGERLRIVCEQTSTGAWVFEVARLQGGAAPAPAAAGRLRQLAESGR